MPLVILLHGYGSSGQGHDNYFGLSRATKARGVLLAFPDGTTDPKGMKFWNASDACCNFSGSNVDDVAYLDAVIDDIAAKNKVDSSRIYMVGHSNGAFMAHRFACERPNRLAAFVALAGVVAQDDEACAAHVSVLQVHGDADKVIDYRGGRSFGNGKPYPSADVTISRWATREGCQGVRASAGPALDLDYATPGAETSRERYDCPVGIDVEFWTMRGSGHIPQFGPRWNEVALDFLLKHRRSEIVSK